MAGAENKLTKHDQMMYNQGRYFFICPVFRFLGGMSWYEWDVAGAFAIRISDFRLRRWAKGACRHWQGERFAGRPYAIHISDSYLWR